MSLLSESEAVFQVGRTFVNTYYEAAIRQPHELHHFYGDFSCVIRVEGSSGRLACTMPEIEQLFRSLNYCGIQVETMNGQASVSGGGFLMVTGFVRIHNVGRRKFVQTFFLAPQEGGYFILNDIFRFVDFNDPADADSQKDPSSSPNPHPPFDNTFEKARLLHHREQQEQQQQLQQANPLQPQPLEESSPKTYASVLRYSKRLPSMSAATRLSIRSAPAEAPTEPVDDRIAFVRNLPLAVTKAELENVMSQYGKIKAVKIIPHAAHKKSFAYVEYEEISSVLEAIKGSPIQFVGRSVNVFKYDSSRDKYSNVKHR